MKNKVLKIIIGIMFFPITLVYLIWAKSNWKTTNKIIGTVGVLIFCLICTAFPEDSEDIETVSNETTTTITTTDNTETTTTEIVTTFTTTVFETTATEIVTTPVTTVSETIATEITLQTELVEPENHCTSEYVDYLARKAKIDAQTATNADIQEAVNWLKDNMYSYFESQENMEKTMYYGELLEYKYKGTKNHCEKTGWQAFKTVKYVYREVDDLYSDVTQENLAELQEMVSLL